jgi:hypothetical protein
LAVALVTYGLLLSVAVGSGAWFRSGRSRAGAAAHRAA